MNRTLIYLVRHGEVRSPGGKRYIGQSDPPLSAEGIGQARRLAQELENVRLTAIWCSDLQRSQGAAEIIAERQQVRPQARSDLREIGLGAWEGLSFEEVRRIYPAEYEARGRDIVGYRPPGGECFADLSRRVIAVFGEIVTLAAGDLLIVGHAGVNRAILCHILGMPLQNLFRLGQDYGCLNLISHSEFGYCAEILGRPLGALPWSDPR